MGILSGAVGQALRPNAHIRCSDAPATAARAALDLQALLAAKVGRPRPARPLPSPQSTPWPIDAGAFFFWFRLVTE